MANQGIKDSGKAELPPLLSGSECKTGDSDIHRAMNLLPLALAIVVYGEKDAVSNDCKEAWFKSFEEQYEKAQLHHKKTINFNARHSPHCTPVADTQDCGSPIYKMILDWLRRSLFASPDWNRLYTLIEVHTVSIRKDPSANWWNKVQSVCRRVETSVDTFDPIAEIRNLAHVPRDNNNEAEPTTLERVSDALSCHPLNVLAAECGVAGDEAPRSLGSSVVHELEAYQQKTGPKPNGPRQPDGAVGTKESAIAAKTVNIQNSNVIMGDVHHPENLVLGDHASIRKETPTSQKNNKNIKRTITASVVFLAGLLTVLQILFGWMGIICRFLTGE